MNKVKHINVVNEQDEVIKHLPIGADAINIDLEDGQNAEDVLVDLQDKIKKKSYYFNNIEEMKSANLKEGDYCITLGYYKANDGGNSEYLIRTKTKSDIDDGGSIHVINDNLVAELIIKDNYVDIRKMGATKNSDISNILNILMNKKYTIFIPKGIWLCSPISIKSGTNIIGENNNYQVGSNIETDLSVLKCNQDCETFIDCSNSQHINLEICLSSCTSKDAYLKAVNINNFIKLDNTVYSTFDVFILCFANNGISIKDSWENTFKRTYFRGVLSPKAVCIKCKESNNNISQNTFYDIQSEGFGATILDASEHCIFTHNKIYSVLVECTKYTPFINANNVPTIKIPLFKISSGGNNIIDSIQINNFSNTQSASYDGQYYEHSIFEVDNSNSWLFGFLISDIILDRGCTKKIEFLNQKGNSNEPTSYLIVNNVISPTANTIGNTMEGMNYFKIKNIITPSGDYNAKLNNSKSITEWYRPSNNGLVPLVSDSTNYNYMNNESAVVKVPTSKQVIASFPVKTGDKIKAIIKNNAQVDFEIKLLKRNNSSVDNTVTITTNSTFQLKTLLDITDTTGKFIAVISAITTGDGYIADIFI